MKKTQHDFELLLKELQKYNLNAAKIVDGVEGDYWDPAPGWANMRYFRRANNTFELKIISYGGHNESTSHDSIIVPIQLLINPTKEGILKIRDEKRKQYEYDKYLVLKNKFRKRGKK